MVFINQFISKKTIDSSEKHSASESASRYQGKTDCDLEGCEPGPSGLL